MKYQLLNPQYLKRQEQSNAKGIKISIKIWIYNMMCKIFFCYNFNTYETLFLNIYYEQNNLKLYVKIKIYNYILNLIFYAWCYNALTFYCAWYKKSWYLLHWRSLLSLGVKLRGVLIWAVFLPPTSISHSCYKKSLSVRRCRRKRKDI